MITITLLIVIPLALFIGYVVGCDESARRKLGPLVSEYRDETARLAKLRKADRTPVGGRRA